MINCFNEIQTADRAAEERLRELKCQRTLNYFVESLLAAHRISASRCRFLCSFASEIPLIQIKQP